MAEHTTRIPAEEVRNVLGRPCHVASAFNRFDYYVAKARKHSSQQTVLRIGTVLNQLVERDEHAGNLVSLACDVAGKDPDADDRTHSMLQVLSDYGLQTNGVICELIGLVLVALEHGNLLEADTAAFAKQCGAKVEVDHG